MVNNTKILNIIYPEKFHTDFIYAYIKFQNELKDLIEKSGYKSDFTRKYRISLTMLDDLKLNCIIQKKRFEKLKKTEGLYSIILHGEKNIRILFTFIHNRGKTIAVLLNVFEEKDKKNNSKTSYNNAIIIANDRVEKLKEL